MHLERTIDLLREVHDAPLAQEHKQAVFIAFIILENHHPDYKIEKRHASEEERAAGDPSHE
ncbi:MAG: hypothetical protein ACYS30_19605 [Planctomycetota bacterium]|jgi:hypothetical protein